MKNKKNKSSFYRIMVNEHPKFRFFMNYLWGLFSLMGNIFFIFSIIFFCFSIFLVLNELEAFKLLENNTIKSCVFGICSLIVAPSILWKIKNRIELRQKLFLDNILFYEELIEELNKIYYMALNHENVSTTDFLLFIKNNGGKIYLLLSNKLLDKISLLLEECDLYNSQDFENIKYYINRCLSILCRVTGKGLFTFFYQNMYLSQK